MDIATEEKFLFVIFSGQYSKIEKYVNTLKMNLNQANTKKENILKMTGDMHREGKELAFYGRKDEFHGQRRIVFEEPSVKE